MKAQGWIFLTDFPFPKPPLACFLNDFFAKKDLLGCPKLFLSLINVYLSTLLSLALTTPPFSCLFGTFYKK